MIRGVRPVLATGALVLGLAAFVAGCGGAEPTPPWTYPPGGAPTPPGTGAPSASPPASPVEGVVVKVETSGLNNFEGFQLRLDDGTVIPFTLGALENATDFPPSHLPEHMAAVDRLRVFFRAEGDELVVYRIEHAM